MHIQRRWLPRAEAAEGDKDGKLQYAAEMVASDSGASAVSTYDCPVCRRAQILDLDRLQVLAAILLPADRTDPICLADIVKCATQTPQSAHLKVLHHMHMQCNPRMHITVRPFSRGLL